MFTQDSIAVIPSDLPDSVIMISKRQHVWLVFIKELYPGSKVIGNTTSLVFWTRPAPQWRKIPKVSTMDSIVRLKVVSKLQEFLA